MNILIITSWFVPDSTIAAVRPYMFAKHLSAMGDNVTVLRSGSFDMLPFDEYDEQSEQFEVISVLGENCDAEKFKRGEYIPPEHALQVRYPFIPLPLRIVLRAFRDEIRKIKGNKIPKCLETMTEVLVHQKKTIDSMKDRRFDVVFATFGEKENILAGIYAAEAFHAKLIIDFRDSAVRHDEWTDLSGNAYGKKLHTMALEKADSVTAVSNALAEELKSYCPGTNVITLYNGFDETKTLPFEETADGIFSFCYTGRMYRSQVPALHSLARCISQMIENGVLDRKCVRFHYAGSSADVFRKPFERNGIADLIVNHGYLSKRETLRLQMSSDVFLVLSWNQQNSQGILTGKFYEGIQAGKPILAVVAGKLPDSELMQLQKQYQYGFCFEQAREKQTLSDLKTFIEQLYHEKLENGRLSYQPSEKLYKAFSYTGIVKELHRIMERTVMESGTQS